jgi:hypothetical protein
MRSRAQEVEYAIEDRLGGYRYHDNDFEDDGLQYGFSPDGATHVTALRGLVYEKELSQLPARRLAEASEQIAKHTWQRADDVNICRSL